MQEGRTEKILELLPEVDSRHARVVNKLRERAVAEKVEDIDQKYTAAELARAKLREKQAIENMEHKKAAAKKVDEVKLAERKKNLDILESIETNQAASAKLCVPEHALPLLGTTKPEVAKLLTSLNINLNLALTKQDTMNLLSSLLTCNESQLQAVYNNKKVPVAIKTVIKRLLDDAKLGNMDTVEKLWDRVFGKSGMVIDSTAYTNQSQIAPGLLPNTVVSREAYMIIRDTIIGDR